MNPNVKLQEKLAVLATLDPASNNAGTYVTSWVKVTDFHNVMALIQTGAMTATGTLDAKLRQASDSSGTGAKDITGKAIAQILAASGSNVQALLECRDDDLDSANGFNYVALSVTIGTAASIFGAALLGGNPRFAVVSGYNQAAVKQLV